MDVAVEPQHLACKRKQAYHNEEEKESTDKIARKVVAIIIYTHYFASNLKTLGYVL